MRIRSGGAEPGIEGCGGEPARTGDGNRFETSRSVRGSAGDAVGRCDRARAAPVSVPEGNMLTTWRMRTRASPFDPCQGFPQPEGSKINMFSTESVDKVAEKWKSPENSCELGDRPPDTSEPGVHVEDQVATTHCADVAWEAW